LIGRAVTNSTCLIGLERIERLDILPQVFNAVFAPPAVAKKVRTSQAIAYLKKQYAMRTVEVKVVKPKPFN
jgi:predicted nucleic acid-binding protein